jgi:hypothetical protein
LPKTLTDAAECGSRVPENRGGFAAVERKELLRYLFWEYYLSGCTVASAAERKVLFAEEISAWVRRAGSSAGKRKEG